MSVAASRANRCDADLGFDHPVAAIARETVHLVEGLKRLEDAARAHELSVDSAAQGVRQLVLLDEELVERAGTSPDGSTSGTSFPDLRPTAQFDLHRIVSGSVLEELDVIVGGAAAMRSQLTSLCRLAVRFGDLAALIHDPWPGFADQRAAVPQASCRSEGGDRHA